MNLNLIGFTIRSFNVVVTFILTVSDDTASQDGGSDGKFGSFY